MGLNSAFRGFKSKYSSALILRQGWDASCEFTLGFRERKYLGHLQN